MGSTDQVRAALIGVLVGLALAAPAFGHGIVIESIPAQDGEAVGPDVPIWMRFNSRLDHARSRIVVRGPGDQVIPVALDPDLAPDELAGVAGDLAAGDWLIEWIVLAADGHITRGRIPFRVVPPN